MTDLTPATVAVPVRLLRKLVEDEPGDIALRAAKTLLPSRRIVAVEDDGTNLSGEYLATLPDLLTLLDELIDDWWNDVHIYSDCKALKRRIRTSLGVTK